MNNMPGKKIEHHLFLKKTQDKAEKKKTVRWTDKKNELPFDGRIVCVA